MLCLGDELPQKMLSQWRQIEVNGVCPSWWAIFPSHSLFVLNLCRHMPKINEVNGVCSSGGYFPKSQVVFVSFVQTHAQNQ